jgi:hypothetical protein
MTDGFEVTDSDTTVEHDNGRPTTGWTLEELANKIIKVQDQAAKEASSLKTENAPLSKRLAQIESTGRTQRSDSTRYVQPAAAIDPEIEEPDGDSPVSRRSVLRALGGVAAGGVGLAIGSAFLGAEPAGAANGNAVLLGETNSATTMTEVTNTGGPAIYGVDTGASGIGFSDAGVVGDTNVDGGSGVVGVSSGGDGVDGFTSVNEFSGVAGFDDSPGGGKGVFGTSGKGTGVWGQTAADLQSGVAGIDSSTGGGYGVYGESTEGIGVYGTLAAGVSGLLDGDVAGVVGDSYTSDGVIGLSSSSDGVSGVTSATNWSGVYGLDSSVGGGHGVYGESTSGYGIKAQGGLAPILLSPSDSAGVPTSRLHSLGELYVDKNGVLYVCVAAGTPGTWVQVGAGPTGFAQGVSCLLSIPIRVFDSRTSDPPAAPSRAAGPLSSGSTQTLQITGTSVGGVEVPADAVAVIGNVTAVDAVGPGYLTLYRYGVTTPGTSSINFPAKTAVANGVTVALSSAGKLDIFASQTTEVIFDATGFIA